MEVKVYPEKNTNYRINYIYIPLMISISVLLTLADGPVRDTTKIFSVLLLLGCFYMVFFMSKKPLLRVLDNQILFITMPNAFGKIKDLREYELSFYPKKIELRTFRKRFIIRKKQIGDVKFNEIAGLLEKLPFDSIVRYKIPTPNAQS